MVRFDVLGFRPWPFDEKNQTNEKREQLRSAVQHRKCATASECWIFVYKNNRGIWVRIVVYVVASSREVIKNELGLSVNTYTLQVRTTISPGSISDHRNPDSHFVSSSKQLQTCLHMMSQIYFFCTLYDGNTTFIFKYYLFKMNLESLLFSNVGLIFYYWTLLIFDKNRCRADLELCCGKGCCNMLASGSNSIWSQWYFW